MSRVRGWTAFAVLASVLELVGHLTVLRSIQQLRLELEQFLADPTSDGRQLDATAANVDTQSLMVVGLGLVAIIAVIGWLHACVKAVAAQGRGPLRHSSGWAIGAWFVPFLNLVRVPQIVADVYRAGRLQVAPAGLVVGTWWAITLLDTGVSRLAMIQGQARSAEQLRALFQLLALTQIVSILATLATLGLVLLLTVGLARAAAAAPAPRAWDPVGQLAHLPPPNPMFGTPPSPQFGAPAPLPDSAPPAYAVPPAQHYPPPQAAPVAPGPASPPPAYPPPVEPPTWTAPAEPPTWTAPDVVRRTYQPE